MTLILDVLGAGIYWDLPDERRIESNGKEKGIEIVKGLMVGIYIILGRNWCGDVRESREPRESRTPKLATLWMSRSATATDFIKVGTTYRPLLLPPFISHFYFPLCV